MRTWARISREGWGFEGGGVGGEGEGEDEGKRGFEVADQSTRAVVVKLTLTTSIGCVKTHATGADDTPYSKFSLLESGKPPDRSCARDCSVLGEWKRICERERRGMKEKRECVRE